ncbi:45407_t:CDS:2 [Gigaspora margarita]|uniref:45407_t:CDS:1 n=1 Tax=Gigaspora margarita TaxID=4874 RepID=A0ABN7WG05_GIGMA|nr:45407_t:CDS:2 [Gigaspora margarita]
MVMSVFDYFQKNKYYQNTNFRKEVVLATGVGERTIDRIFAEYDQNKEFKPPKYEQLVWRIVKNKIAAEKQFQNAISLRNALLHIFKKEIKSDAVVLY